MIDDKGLTILVTFPVTIDHDVMAEALSRMKNQTCGQWERVHREVVSAGFVNELLECHGESYSLGVPSDPNDTKLLRNQLKAC